MSDSLTKAIQQTYGSVARSTLSSDHSGVHAVAEAFGYPADEMASIPADANMGLSCGNRRASVPPRLRIKERQTAPGYTLSQRCRKKIEEAFGWIKTVAGLARTKLIGRWKIVQQMQLAAAAYNLVRMRKLAA